LKNPGEGGTIPRAGDFPASFYPVSSKKME